MWLKLRREATGLLSLSAQRLQQTTVTSWAIMGGNQYEALDIPWCCGCQDDRQARLHGSDGWARSFWIIPYGFIFFNHPRRPPNDVSALGLRRRALIQSLSALSVLYLSRLIHSLHYIHVTGKGGRSFRCTVIGRCCRLTILAPCLFF